MRTDGWNLLFASSDVVLTPECHTEVIGRFRKPAVARPQERVRREKRGRKQMQIHPAESTSGQFSRLDECEHLVVVDTCSVGKRLVEAKRLRTIPEIAAGELAPDEGVGEDFAFVEQVHKLRVRLAVATDPHRGVNEDHAGSGLRLGISRSCG